MTTQISMMDEVQRDLISKDIPITSHNLMTGMEKKGFNGTRFQFYNIRNRLNETDTFVMDISQTQYSSMIHGIWDKLEFVEQEAMKLFSADWEIKKTRTSQATSDEADRNRWEEIEANQYKPKHDFLELIGKIQKQKLELMKGDVLNVSIAMLEKKFQQLRDESEAKSQELKHWKKKLKANNGHSS
jgi:hypothetical protein